MSEFDGDLHPLYHCHEHGLVVPRYTWYGKLLWVDCPECRAWCEAEEERIRLHHIIPLSQGGKHELSNIMAVPVDEHVGKHGV